MMKTAYFIAGANGAGKTTIAKELLGCEPIIFLNADEIAYNLSPSNIADVKITAGKQLLSDLASLIKQEKSFAIETTLSGTSHLKIIDKLKKHGYTLHLFYIFLDSPDTCIERIKTREAKGGHHIPAADVVRRYHRSIRNFWHLYKDQFASWALYYNGPEQIIPVARAQDTEIDILDKALYDSFIKRCKK